MFQLLGAGLGTRQIAEEMNLSFKTIETYRENIKHKLGLRDAAELIHRATTWVQSHELPRLSPDPRAANKRPPQRPPSS